MGWTSSSDPMSHVKLNFDTKEDAVAFARKNGWKHEVLRESSKGNVTPGTLEVFCQPSFKPLSTL